MKIAYLVVVSLSIFLVHQRVDAQCEAENSAMDTCMDNAGTGDAAKSLCDLCIEGSAAAASAANATCEGLSSQDSGLCAALSICLTCPEECASEQQAYALCEFNDEANTTCTTLSCDTPSPPTTGPPTTGPPTGAPCEDEDSAMDTCMDTAGTSNAAKSLCDLCIQASATAASVVGATCEELSSQDSMLCTSLSECPTCPEECFSEQQAYALCAFNDEANTTCTTLSCPSTGASCEAEDSAMDTCMDTAGTGDAGKLACDLCIRGSAAAASVANATCEDLSSQDNGLCTALSVCLTCPEECASEQQAYALCEFNDEADTSCTTLACDSSNPPTTGPPTSGPPTTEPPTSGPPTTEPPTTDPPTSGPPTTEPPATEVPSTASYLSRNRFWQTLILGCVMSVALVIV